MAKLRKPCKSNASSIQSDTSTSGRHQLPPSIALRTTTKSPAIALAPSIDVTGEFDHAGGSMVRSSSSTYSIDSLSRSSPISQRQSHLSHHRRTTSTTSSIIPDNDHSPSSPTRIAHAATSSISSSPSTSSFMHHEGESSALTQLRQRLDSDRDAREAIKERQAASGSKLKKKQRPENTVQVAEELEGGGNVGEEEGGGDRTEEDNRDEDEETRGEVIPEVEEGMVEEEVQTNEVPPSSIHEESTTLNKVDESTQVDNPEPLSSSPRPLRDVPRLSTSSTSTSSQLLPSSASSSNPPLQRQSTDSPPLRPFEPPPSIITTSSSILFAPARLGWRIASGTVGYGVDTGKSIVKKVPIVGSRLIGDDDSVPSSPSSDNGATIKGQNGGRESMDVVTTTLPSPTSSQISFAPSTASALRRANHHDGESCSSSVDDNEENVSESTQIDHTNSTRSNQGEPSRRHVDNGNERGKEPVKVSTRGGEEDEHGLVYRAAELSLGLGIASVLVGGALGKMAWNRVVHRGSGASSMESPLPSKR